MQCINRMIVSVVSVFDCLLNCSTGTARVHNLFQARLLDPRSQLVVLNVCSCCCGQSHCSWCCWCWAPLGPAAHTLFPDGFETEIVGSCSQAQRGYCLEFGVPKVLIEIAGLAYNWHCQESDYYDCQLLMLKCLPDLSRQRILTILHSGWMSIGCF